MTTVSVSGSWDFVLTTGDGYFNRTIHGVKQITTHDGLVVVYAGTDPDRIAGPVLVVPVARLLSAVPLESP